MPSPRRSPIIPASDAAALVRIRRVDPAAAPVRNLQDLIARLHVNRGATPRGAGAEGLAALVPPESMLGIDRASALLADSITAGRRILVVGDYDADGATGSAVALLGLRALGAAEIDYLIPSRFRHGYGLSPAVVDAAAERDPGLLITVDNGIASHAGVERANALGVPVLITDHHLPGAELPPAAAILNPNQPGCPFPSKHLAGVGVMFYLLIATRARLREQGWLGGARPDPRLADLLDLVALGTVADVVTLDGNNRILVEQGLRRIRAGRCRPGLRALLDIAGCRVEHVSARDLGFEAGPRLNAAGRLEDMGVGVECLAADDPVRAMTLARRLHALNGERREIEHGMREAAEAMVRRLIGSADGLPAGLCLFGEDWHQGVVGIVAARIREHCHRPVIAFADAGEGRLQGSARSIDGLHIRDLIDRIDKERPGLIERFGGHAMAAGVTLPRAALEPFREAFAEAVTRELGDTPPVREILSDGELPARLLSLDTAEALRLCGPWGKGFPEPIFDGVFEVSDSRVVAERHLRLRVRAPGGMPLQAIGFGLGDRRKVVGDRVRLAYRLDVNEYRGLRAPQLQLDHVEAADDQPPSGAMLG